MNLNGNTAYRQSLLFSVVLYQTPSSSRMISPNYAPNGYDFFGIFHFFFGTFGSIASNPQESGMRVAERLTAIRLKTLEKDTACGVVPGLYLNNPRLKARGAVHGKSVGGHQHRPQNQ